MPSRFLPTGLELDQFLYIVQLCQNHLLQSFFRGRVATYIIYGCAIVACSCALVVIIILGFLAYAMLADKRGRDDWKQ